jgi:MoaA/NifB/PqqE/SkfB family radical SAM enzyme
MKRVLRTLKTLATRRLTITFDKIDFTYTDMSMKRLANWFITELSYVLKSNRVWAYPTHLQVEPVSGCNLSCPLCYIVTHNIPKGSLKLSDFRRLMDEVGDYLLFLHFWGWGEPFLNQDIFSMIKYAKKKGIKIITSTNGHFFENTENVDRVIDSELDVLVVALDGVDQKTYEQYRKRGDFERVMRGLRSLLHHRSKAGRSPPLINLRMVVTKENEHQIPQMQSLAQNLGVDVLTLKTLGPHDDDTLWEKSLPLNPAYRRYEYDDEGHPIRKKNSCKKMWNHPTVFHDGTVSPCDYSIEVPLGDAFAEGKHAFRRVWFSKNLQELRARFLGDEVISLRCGNCPLNYTSPHDYVSHAIPIRGGSGGSEPLSCFRPEVAATTETVKY